MAKLGRELAAKGVDVISLSFGEPDFHTPEYVKEAAKKAMDENFTYYTPVSGYPELRKAIAAKLKNENGLDYDFSQIVVSTGAKQAIANAVLCLVNPGEEVIIPTPYWVSYSEVVKLAEGKSVFIDTTVEQEFKITPEQLEAAITPNTKLFMFSSPCNPTGSVYNKAERFFAEGDRIQFRAPFAEKRIVNGELGTINKIEPEHLRVALDSGREVTFDPQQFRHLDHGYAVTSHSSQGLTFDRVLVNVDTRQSAQLVNDRMAYVAISRARDDAQIYTDSAQNLRDTLDRSINKQSAFEATRDSLLDLRNELDKLRRENPLAPQQQPSTEHSLTQTPTHTPSAPTKAAEPQIEGPDIDLGDLIL